MKERCSECKCLELIEEFEGAQLTCTSCGVIGRTEEVPSVDYLTSSFNNFLINDNSFLIKMAQDFIDSADIADSMTSLKIMRKRPRHRVSKKY